METESTSPIPSLPARLIKVFVSPGELFTALRENPAWFGVLAVGSFLVFLSMFLVPADLWTQMFREQAAAELAVKRRRNRPWPSSGLSDVTGRGPGIIPLGLHHGHDSLALFRFLLRG